MRKFTKRGYDAIVAEIERLWNEERPFVLEEIYEAAQLGDRSENAAYIYGKQRLRMIDKRLNMLKKKIKDVRVIDTDALEQKDVVEFGALVTIEDEFGNERRYRLVDKEEIEPEKNWISVQSPMGRALLGLSTDDDFELHLPKGIKNYEVLHIHYGPDPIDDSKEDTE